MALSLLCRCYGAIATVPLLWRYRYCAATMALSVMCRYYGSTATIALSLLCRCYGAIATVSLIWRSRYCTATMAQSILYCHNIALRCHGAAATRQQPYYTANSLLPVLYLCNGHYGSRYEHHTAMKIQCKLMYY